MEDFSNKKDVYARAIGDRVATFMAYLSNVELGGSTSFPLLGIASKPQIGDAVFWVNLRASGLSDPLTVHAGCPVIVGDKWITNKWILYFDQYEKFKCKLGKDETFDTFHKFRSQSLANGKYYMN
jgi:prolyl 4-hydroxylase